MPPVRTKERPSSDEVKKGSKIRHRKGRAQTDSNTLPGVQKLKSSIRQTKRFLAKDKLAADVRVETERRLKALELDLQKAELARKERQFSVKYHKIKFFERQKVVRKINQTKRQLECATGNSDNLKLTLHELRVDLNYILHYPKTKKYISLFPPVAREGEVRRSEAEAVKTNDQREEIRSWIREQMETGQLPAAPDENNPQSDSRGRAHHQPEKGNTKKIKEKGETGTARLSDDIEQDAFFGDDDGDDESDGRSE